MKMRAAVIAILLIRATMGFGQTIPDIDRTYLTELTGRNSDTTYVINFWATWCSPCVKEIGYFQELHEEYASRKLKVILVSLDFPNQKEKRVVPFLEEKGITAPVKLLSDLDYNGWINLVDPSWSGAIPATLIYNSDGRVFLEKELTRNELYEHVEQILD
jgi:thiol-disulfide isomerase/thioredoxin